MIGGFLGAGKTTLISRLARHYTDLGKKIGLVTNDQAYGLVDTEHLRSQGFDVGEVLAPAFVANSMTWSKPLKNYPKTLCRTSLLQSPLVVALT